MDMMNVKAWDDRYKAGPEELPWDSGTPAPELTAYIESLPTMPASALEIGCGTGTNAIWLAQRGCRVVATDVSPTAIEMANEKARRANVDVTFMVQNILAECPVPPGSIEFVFDRGVYHVMDADVRSLFAHRVAEALSDDGTWLCLAGSADELRENPNEGPPQLKARDIIDNVEPYFELIKMERSSFLIPSGKEFLCWIATMKKRSALTKGQHDLAALWEEHCAAEFERKDVPATLNTMIDEPYVNHIPTMTGGLGKEALSRFYQKHFVSVLPADTKVELVSRTVSANRLVDEIIFCFTHDRVVDFLLPGVQPTGKYVEAPTVVVVTFDGGKIANEHIYWDQASVLVQIGLLDPKGLPVAGIEVAKKVRDRSRPSNMLLGG